MAFKHFLYGLIIIGSIGSAAGTLAQTYKVTLLEFPAELNVRSRTPFAINNSGQIVGEYIDGNTFDNYGFVYENGSVQNLGLYVTPWDINDNGDIIYRRGVNYYLFRNGSETVLLGPSGESVRANSINKVGTIVGDFAAAEFAQYVSHALLITGGTAIDIGTFEGNDPSISSSANSINDLGVIVGSSETSEAGVCCAPTGRFGFVYQNGVMSSLGHLDTVIGNKGLYSGANDINSAGVIVGAAQERRAFSWPSSAVIWRDGKIKSMHPPVKLNSWASAINESGDVVGGTYQPGLLVTNAAWLWKGGIGTGIPLNSQIPSDAGAYLTRAVDINDSGQIICEGLKIVNGSIAFDTIFSFLLIPDIKTLTLLDDNGDTLRNVTVLISKVAYDTPLFTETEIGEFTCNSNGQILFTDGEINEGDSIRVVLQVHRKPSVKHKDILATMYSVELDNAAFSNVGRPSFTEIDDNPNQDIELNHSTFLWSLVVSIEWDAKLDYLNSTKAAFERLSNYFYDVTDGQMRFDTVIILDDKQYWGSADIRMYASNWQWAQAQLDGINNLLFSHIHMPRKWFGNDTSGSEGSFSEYPLKLDKPVHYQTLGHEFGHYGLGLYDEYFPKKKAADRCSETPNYGFMDCQYAGPRCEPYNSELSTANRYAAVACQNNRQWKKRKMSCWDYVEKQFEGNLGARNIFVPITMPSERVLPIGIDYLLGPNIGSERGFTDYAPSTIVHFPITHGAPAANNVIVGVYGFFTGNPLKYASVRLLKPNPVRRVYQGKTNKNGKIIVLGANTFDIYDAWGKVVEEAILPSRRITAGESWVYGRAVQATGTSSVSGNSFKWSAANDSLDIFLRPVAGEYPFIVEATFSGSDVQLRMEGVNLFSSPPKLTLEIEDDSAITTLSPVIDGSGYTTVISDSLRTGGVFILEAVDDSSFTFLVPFHYALGKFDGLSSDLELDGWSGASNVLLDSSNSTVENILFVSSQYPVIRNGLDLLSRQAGDAQSLAVTPANPLTGTNLLTIRYEAGDLGDSSAIADLESSLRMHLWDNNLKQWKLIGGSVDVELKEVSADIDQPGVYAAFTTAAPSNCCLGSTGNIDCDPNSVVDIADLTTLIDHLFIGLQPLCCKGEGNIDGDPTGEVTLADLTKLIDHLFISLSPTAACQ